MSNTLYSLHLEKELAELLEQFENWRSNLTDEEIHKLAETIGCEVSELEEDDFLWEWDSSDNERIKSIQNLKDQQIYGWDRGVLFVKDSHFEDFAIEEAKNCNNVDINVWPFNCIDWSKAADYLQNEYSSVEFDGETYWYRDC